MDPLKFFGPRVFMAPDASGGGGTPPAAPPAAPPATPPAPPPEPPAKKEMTQTEIDALVAGAKKEGGEKLWKKHGFESEKAFEDFLTASKADADAKKTESQKNQDAKDAAEKREREANARADKAEAKAEALSLGVSPEKADRFIKLAMTYDGDTMKAKVEAALKENPEFKGKAQVEVPNANVRIKSQTPTMAAADAELDKVFGRRPEQK